MSGVYRRFRWTCCPNYKAKIATQIQNWTVSQIHLTIILKRMSYSPAMELWQRMSSAPAPTVEDVCVLTLPCCSAGNKSICLAITKTINATKTVIILRRVRFLSANRGVVDLLHAWDGTSTHFATSYQSFNTPMSPFLPLQMPFSLDISFHLTPQNIRL